jgi:hypothetical protein
VRIDLNADVGESYGPYTIGADAELMPNITSANVADSGTDGFVALFDQNLNLRALQGFDSDGGLRMQGLALHPDGSLALGGRLTGTLDAGSFTRTKRSGFTTDLFIGRYQP